MAILPLALVIGLGREPSLGLAGDLRRLNWRVQLAPWPAFKSGWRGAKPGVVVIDFRALNAEAAAACRAVRAGSALRRVPLLAVVPEQEAAGVDLSLGLDDLLLSPYRLTDLEARVRVLRWRQARERTAGVLRAGRLTLDPATYQAAIDGVPLDQPRPHPHRTARPRLGRGLLRRHPHRGCPHPPPPRQDRSRRRPDRDRKRSGVSVGGAVEVQH